MKRLLLICTAMLAVLSLAAAKPAAGTIEYALAPKGELRATITYTPPTKDVDGNVLASISKAVVTVNGTKDYTFDKVEPGKAIVFDAEMANHGGNRIEAVAYDGDEVGETASVRSFFVGPDYPQSPTNVYAQLSADGKKVTLTWDAVPEVGDYGGYVDVENVTYAIFDAFGSWTDPALAFTTETSYTFDYSDVDTQDFKAYQVTATNGDINADEALTSGATSSNIVVTGPATPLPYFESFAAGEYQQPWALDPHSDYYGWVAGTVKAEDNYVTPYDNDGGCFYIAPKSKWADKYGIISAKVDISNASVATNLDFWACGTGGEIEVLVSIDGSSFYPAMTVKPSQEATDGWHHYSCPFIPETDVIKNYAQIELRFDSKGLENIYMAVDNLSVVDQMGNDICVMYVRCPESVKAGEDIKLEALIQNNMSTASGEIELVLSCDPKQMPAMQTVSGIEPKDKRNVVMTYSTNAATPEKVDLQFSIYYNNVEIYSFEKTVTVIPSALPAVTGLGATVADGQVSLSWDAFEIKPSSSEVVTEDFENPAYGLLTITDFGEWTMYDGDGAKTYTFFGDILNPYRTQPMAFQLFNPVAAGVPEERLIDCETHSGNQMMVAWSCEGKNDNWLISPKLSGRAQTVSFFAKAFSVIDPEEFEVFYSTTDNKPASFVKVDQVGNYPAVGEYMPEVWVEYTAALPEGATYFAIRHTAVNSWALFVDDITFEKAAALPGDLELLGYNIYSNGAKLNDAPVVETSFTDKNPLLGETNKYNVTAVFNYGEGKAGEGVEVYIDADSVTDIVVDSTEAEYYNLQGVRVAVDNLCPGIYVRVSGSKAEKVIVR